jgi:hypothetical protein
MSHPILLIAGILLLGGLYVLLPQYLTTFFSHRKPMIVKCPETGVTAQIGIDAQRLALTSLIDNRRMRVKNCSLWCDREGCSMGCLKDIRPSA